MSLENFISVNKNYRVINIISRVIQFDYDETGIF